MTTEKPASRKSLKDISLINIISDFVLIPDSLDTQSRLTYDLLVI